jgi:hypothetical protein
VHGAGASSGAAVEAAAVARGWWSLGARQRAALDAEGLALGPWDRTPGETMTLGAPEPLAVVLAAAAVGVEVLFALLLLRTN